MLANNWNLTQVGARSLSVSSVDNTWPWVGLAAAGVVVVVGVVILLLRTR